MKNVLQYYYNLVPTSIHQINNDYRCQVGKKNYLFYQIDKNPEELTDIFELNKQLFISGIPVHKIIRNESKNLVTYVDNKPYILMEIFIGNYNIQVRDILLFSNLYVDKGKFKSLNRSNWYELWTSKVDYIEYQYNQLGKKYPIINESINYYVGMAENAISLLKYANVKDMQLVVAHKRIKYNDNVKNIYDPTKLILDIKIRDISEYIKNYFFSSDFLIENVNAILSSYNMNYTEALLLYARILFPTYYFDCYQDIILGEVNELEISKYIARIDDYQDFLSYLYTYFSKKYKFPEIEWIKKRKINLR